MRPIFTKLNNYADFSRNLTITPIFTKLNNYADFHET